jgi:hypothetical protein
VPDQRECKLQPPLLARGQRAVARRRPVGQAEPLEQPLRLARVDVEGGVQPQHLPGARRRPGAAVLEHDAELGHERRTPRDRVAAEHRHAAGVGPPQPGEAFDGCGLAGPVGPEERTDAALGHAQGEAVDGDDLAIALRELLDADGVSHAHLSGSISTPERRSGLRARAEG